MALTAWNRFRHSVYSGGTRYNRGTSIPSPEECEAQPDAPSFRVQPDALWWRAVMLQGLYVSEYGNPVAVNPKR
jgi:hypothetical protein